MAPSQRNKAIVTYDGGNVNGIHHTGGICHRGGKAIRTHFIGLNAKKKEQTMKCTAPTKEVYQCTST